MTTHALVPCVLVPRDLRLEHELAVLDGSDAVTNLVPPIHPIPSAAPTALARHPRRPCAPPPRPSTPSRAQHRRPWLGLDDNYPDDNYPDDNYSRSALTDHNVACRLVHDNHDPNPGRSTDGTWPDNPSNRSATHQGESQTKLRKIKNRIQQTEVDGEM